MPLPYLSVAEMRLWENATWATGTTPAWVIALVGQKVAESLRQLVPSGARIVLLAGKGHNGDDTRACVEHLQDFQVELIDCADPVAGLKRWRGLTTRPALVVDGLFGIGLNRPLEGPWRALIDAVNQSDAPVVAIDIPSGLCADTGVPLGAAIRASLTLTLGAPKRGLLAAGAAEYVGRLEVVEDIGLVDTMPAATCELVWSSAADFLGFPPRRSVTSHKGTFGHVGIVAGSPGYHGAAVLAARGGQRGGAGLVTVITPEASYLPVAGQLQSAMVRAWEWSEEFPDNLTALVVGPGLASPKLPATLKAAVVERWMNAPFPVVADASALDWIGETRFPELRVVTPHPGEAARLLGIATSVVQADRPGALRALSRRFGGCHVVLKGHETLTGRATGLVAVNGSGNPGLAQGGAGDLLAGFIGGCLAGNPLNADLAVAVGFAVWGHGAAADRLGRNRRRFAMEDLAIELGQWDGNTLPPAGPIC